MSFADLQVLAGGFLSFLLYGVLEWFQPSKYYQYTIKDLYNPQTLSYLLGKEVTDVSSYSKSRFDSSADEAELGAGGTGTERSSFVATFADGSKHHLFAKFPSRKFAERVFLTIFRVYINEVVCYDRMMSLPVEVRHLFPKAYCSRMISKNTGKFIVILEDVAFRNRPDGTGCEFRSLKSDDFSKSDCKAVLSQLARLHGYCWGKPPSHVWHHDPATGLGLGDAPPRCPVILKEGGKKVQEKFGAVVSFPPDVLAAYNLSVDEFPAIRAFWSRQELTCCHGDSHVGNYCFFPAPAGGRREVGLFDLQCMAAEHGMRDVSYHLITSCSADRLPADEEELIRHYLAELKTHFAASHGGAELDLDYEQAYFLYRCFAVTTLHAFFATAGFADMVIDSAAVVSVQRTVSTCHRLDILSALRDVLKQTK
jgi:hypothetical protein